MARYGLTLQTAPTIEPVTFAEAQRQIGLAAGNDFDQERIEGLITAARLKLERMTNRAFVNQTWDLTLDCFPTGLDPIYLPKAPVVSVTHVKHYDTSNVQQTIATSVYKVLTAREPGEIHLKYQQQWPSLYSEASVVEVRFVAGYGATASTVPQTARKAILLDVHSMYDPEDAGDIEATYNALADSLAVGDEFHCYAR